MAVHGPIPEGMVVHHKCYNRACYNIDHLELRTQRDNILDGSSPSAVNARKEVCVRGHDLSRAYVSPRGRRKCRECRRILRDPAI